MSEAEKSPRLTCGAMLLACLLALLVVVALHRQAEQPSWAATGAAAVAVVAVFIIERGVQNFLGGLAAAALLTWHPSWTQYPENDAEVLLAGAVVLAAVAATRVSWHLAWHPDFAWRSWPLAFAAQTVCVGLAWKGNAHLGILTLMLCMAGLWAAAFLGSRHRQRKPAVLPSRLNLLTAGALVFLTPPASLVVYRFVDRSLRMDQGWWRLVRGSFPDSIGLTATAFQSPAESIWGWPAAWLVLPILAWALFLTVRRGWQQWSVSELPAAWFLTLFALVVGVGVWLQPPAAASGAALVLTALTVLLIVFWISYLLRAFFERLVLRPPEEQAPNAGSEKADGMDGGGKVEAAPVQGVVH